jgi:NAD-dependent oxidoreductase involved in siderophore biosynthesis
MVALVISCQCHISIGKILGDVSLLQEYSPDLWGSLFTIGLQKNDAVAYFCNSYVQSFLSSQGSEA